MRIRQKTGMALTALLIILNVVPVLNVKAEDTSEDMDRMQDSVSSSDFVVSPGSVSSSDAGASFTESGGVLRFSADVEYSPQGYVVVGALAELPPEACLVQPLASADGENWQICPREWNLPTGVSEDGEVPAKLRTQSCLYDTHEPFRSYLAGELDLFYVKLRITEENGAVRETETAVIQRGEPQPLPEDLTPVAMFDRSVLIRKWRPQYREYGQYRVTVGENAAAGDVAALLPETVPIEVDLYRGIDFVAGGTIDCPVVWKPLTLPELAAGESVTILDAAEEILVPGGTLLSTPKGIYRLEEPLRIRSSGEFPHSDEIRLILDVAAEQADSGELQGVEDSARPNGDGSADQPGNGGAGGNEGNAGTDDRGDSTEEGQRPNLPEEAPEEPSKSESGQEAAGASEEPVRPQETGDSRDMPESPAQSQSPEEAPGEEKKVQSPKEAPGEEKKVHSPKEAPNGKDGQGTAGASEEPARQQEAGDSRDMPESRTHSQVSRAEKPVQARKSEAGVKGYGFSFTAAGVILGGITAASVCIVAIAGGKRRRIKYLQGDL